MFLRSYLANLQNCPNVLPACGAFELAVLLSAQWSSRVVLVFTAVYPAIWLFAAFLFGSAVRALVQQFWSKCRIKVSRTGEVDQPRRAFPDIGPAFARDFQHGEGSSRELPFDNLAQRV